jgi:hypothetical protein
LADETIETNENLETVSLTNQRLESYFAVVDLFCEKAFHSGTIQNGTENAAAKMNELYTYLSSTSEKYRERY